MTGDLNRWRTGDYKPGQFVVCTVVQQVHGGYNVMLEKDDLPGYLPSDREHSIGDQVKAAFVCVDKNRMLLTERFSFDSPGDGPEQNVPKFPLMPIDGSSSSELAEPEPDPDDFV